jgi:hypothetical protein
MSCPYKDKAIAEFMLVADTYNPGDGADGDVRSPLQGWPGYLGLGVDLADWIWGRRMSRT